MLVQRRPRRGPLAQPGLDRRSAYEIALDELARIERLDLPGQERFKEHYTLVSDCVRRYIDREYRIPAIDQTTDEVRSELRRTTIVAEHSSQAVALLRDCDLVKFAKFEPEVAAAHQTTGQARRLVGLLRLVPADLTLGPEAAEPSGGTP